jgi:hypothetical protein
VCTVHSTPQPIASSTYTCLFFSNKHTIRTTVDTATKTHRTNHHSLTGGHAGFGQPFAPISLYLVSSNGTLVGTASPSTTVNVTMAGLVDSEGLWRVRLPPQPGTLANARNNAQRTPHTTHHS